MGMEQKDISKANYQKPLKDFGCGLLLIVIVFCLSVFVTAIFEPLIQLVTDSKSWVMFTLYVIIFTLTYFIAKAIWKNEKIELSRVPLWVYPLLIPATFSLLFLQDIFTHIIPVSDDFIKGLSEIMRFDLPSFLSIVIAAPILEELIFRGVILNAFLKKYTPQKAILLSALLFGIFHLNIWQFMSSFTDGLFIGWIFYKTRSVIPVIFIHILHNGLTFAMSWIYNDVNVDIPNKVGGAINYTVLLVVSAIVFFSCYKILLKYLPQNKSIN